MWAVTGSNPPRCFRHGGNLPQIKANAERAVEEARNRLTNQHYRKEDALSNKTFQVGDKVEAVNGEAYGKGIRTVVDVTHRSSYNTVTTTPISGYTTIYFSEDELKHVEKKADTLKESVDAVIAQFDKAITVAEQKLQTLRDARAEVVKLNA